MNEVLCVLSEPTYYFPELMKGVQFVLGFQLRETQRF